MFVLLVNSFHFVMDYAELGWIPPHLCSELKSNGGLLDHSIINDRSGTIKHLLSLFQSSTH